MLARSAYMLGRDDDYVAGLERAHAGYLDRDDVPSRSALWLLDRSQFPVQRRTGPRERLVCPRERSLESFGGDCVERGYLLIPVWLEQMGGGDFEDGYATALQAAEIGERSGIRIWSGSRGTSRHAR